MLSLAVSLLQPLLARHRLKTAQPTLTPPLSLSVPLAAVPLHVKALAAKLLAKVHAAPPLAKALAAKPLAKVHAAPLLAKLPKLYASKTRTAADRNFMLRSAVLLCGPVEL